MFPHDTGLGSLRPASVGVSTDAVQGWGGPSDRVGPSLAAQHRICGSSSTTRCESCYGQHKVSWSFVGRVAKRRRPRKPGDAEYIAFRDSLLLKKSVFVTLVSEEISEEYVFTTGVPRASNARLSIAVSCSSEKECDRQRALVSEQGMQDTLHLDPISQKHCEAPHDMSWCNVHGNWAPSWAPASHREEDVQLSGVPDQAVSEVQSISLPSWVYIIALACWVQGTFATLRAAWWVSDSYTQSRDFDPYIAQALARSAVGAL
eukprot:g22522.t1